MPHDTFLWVGIAVIAALTGWIIYAVVQDKKAFEAELSAKYQECIDDGENKWLCEQVIATMRVGRSADRAAANAGMAAGIAAMNAGR